MQRSDEMQASVVNGRLALAGICGGVLYAISDDLLFLGAHLPGMLPDPAWAGMPVWRFVASAWIALFATTLLICGFVSLYHMVRETCGTFIQRCTLYSLVGFGGVLLTHFNIGVLLPLVYKAMLASGLPEASFAPVGTLLSSWLGPLNMVTIIFLYLQLGVLAYGVLGWRFGLNRRILLVVFALPLIITVLKLVAFGSLGISGCLGGTESLFEGALYIIPLAYWSGSQPTARQSRADGV